MKYLRIFLAVGTLTVVLTNSALAGEIPFGITHQLGQSQATPMGDMPTGGATAGDPTVTEIALALMQSALLLF